MKHIRTNHSGTENSAPVIISRCEVYQLAEVKEKFLAHPADHTKDETSLGKEEVGEAKLLLPTLH